MLRCPSSTMQPTSFPPRASPRTRKPHVRGLCYYSDTLLARGGRLLRLEGLFDQRLELPLLVHLEDDVAAADELAADEHLRDGRPVADAAQDLTDAGVGEDVDGLERPAELLEDGDRPRRETAHRHVGRPLGEQADGVGVDFLLDHVENFLGHCDSPGIRRVKPAAARWPSRAPTRPACRS